MNEKRNSKRRWNTANIGSQKGRSVVITGTGGLGYETALVLSEAGAEVILAGRNKAKGEVSVNSIRKLYPKANIRFEQLDLADLSSVEAFSLRIKKQLGSLDILINNAGVMATPTRKSTKDGFELQFGTNYLGHFALTAHLIPLLQKSDSPRVVNLSSMAHRSGTINFDDLQSEYKYNPNKAYSQSKLACLMFSFELQRRSNIAGWGIRSIGVNPGGVATDLIPNGPGKTPIMKWIVMPTLQTPSEGTRSSLFAATSPEAKGGLLYGPTGFMEIWGPPKLVKPAQQAEDVQVAAKLWDISKQLVHMENIV